MTRAALTKLLILVILAFIICLPEFFTLYRASKVNFLCLPYQPCEGGNQVKGTRENGKIREAEIRRKDMCNPSQTAEREKWEQACTQEDQSNTTDPASDSRRGGEDPEESLFMCDTDMDMAELNRNISDSDLKVYFKVSVQLQLTDAETLNLTLYGLSNHTSLHLHPPEEEEEEEEEKKDDEEQRKAFYCCLPAPPTSESANQSRCLLWFANKTVLTATAKEKLPWKRTERDEWRCMFRVLWLVLLCVVLLSIVTVVLGQVYRGRCLCQKPKVRPVGYYFINRQLNDCEKHTDIITPEGMIFHSSGSRSWSELSAIQEVDSQDDIETLLDGHVEQCFTANLHHRSHPSSSSSSSLTEEQAW